MKKKQSGSVVVSKGDGKISIDVPRQFTVDGVEHAAILTLGVIILGGIIQSQAALSSILPSPFKEYPSLSLWAALLGVYALFLLCCLMGVGTRWLWRFGDLGQRGSFIALALYSVHVEVSPSGLAISNRWFLRRRTHRFSVGRSTSVKPEGADLVISTGTGQVQTVWFSLYPPTIKELSREIEVALRELQKGTPS